jgi:transcriptional antiterminator RfaH
MRQWFVIQTNPREEERALHYVNEKGVETFFPKIQVVRHNGVTIGKIIRPMFPSYLFARFDVSDELRKVRWTRGVKRILSNGDKPVAVDDEMVDFIKDQVDDNGITRVGRRLSPNGKARIQSSRYKQLSEIFERVIPDLRREEILHRLIRYKKEKQAYEPIALIWDSRLASRL